MANYDFITINGTDFPRPVKFAPQREDVIVSKITTMTGKILGDRIGWKFSDLTLSWDMLPQSLVEELTSIQGTAIISFDDVDGEYTEEANRQSVVQMRHRYTIGGVYYWKNVSVDFEFVNAHSDEAVI